MKEASVVRSGRASGRVGRRRKTAALALGSAENWQPKTEFWHSIFSFIFRVDRQREGAYL